MQFAVCSSNRGVRAEVQRRHLHRFCPMGAGGRENMFVNSVDDPHGRVGGARCHQGDSRVGNKSFLLSESY